MKPRLYFRRGLWYCSGGPYLTRAPKPQNAYWAWRLEYDRRFAFKPVDLGALQ